MAKKNIRRKDRTAADGTISCSNCDNYWPADHYGKTGSWCRKCRADAETERRRRQGVPPGKRSRIESGCKLCLNCEQLLPFEKFAKASRGLGGLAAYCKLCHKTRYKPTKEQARQTTAAYRQRHPERVRANQRLYQRRRISGLKATADGTVTDEVLRQLYRTTKCQYCRKTTPIKQRTADHVVPLSRGGLHAASNLVMACRDCNSSKRDSPADQFVPSPSHPRTR